MKSLLLASLFLLLPLPVWAGELSDYNKCFPKRPNCVSFALPDLQPGESVSIGVGVSSVLSTDLTGAIRPYPQTDCLATMQAAMQAMEFFSLLSFEGTYQMSFHYVQPDKDRLILPYENPAEYTPYGLTQTLNAKAGRAIVLWAEAKRCWK